MSDLQQRTGDNSNECNFQSQICHNKPPFVVCGDYEEEEEEEEEAILAIPWECCCISYDEVDVPPAYTSLSYEEEEKATFAIPWECCCISYDEVEPDDIASGAVRLYAFGGNILEFIIFMF